MRQCVRVRLARRLDMPVNVDHLSSDLMPEAEPGQQPPSGGPASAGWEAVERLRAAQARLMEDRLRTRAEGFDD